MLTLAERLEAAGKREQALAVYREFRDKNPDYPDQIGLSKIILELDRRIHAQLINPLTH
jgi:hypothetical protein